jgi:hypothetical protein
MRTLEPLISITLLLVLAISTPGWARMVKIETAAPLADRSDASVEVALKDAVDICVRGAGAMGLAWIRLQQVVLAGDQLVVRMLASDEDQEDEDQGGEDEVSEHALDPTPATQSL